MNKEITNSLKLIIRFIGAVFVFIIVYFILSFFGIGKNDNTLKLAISFALGGLTFYYGFKKLVEQIFSLIP